MLRDGGGDRTLREHLIATAARLIAERGSAGLTVRDIAREAQVADGVLYNHFADKEELLAHALHSHAGAAMAIMGEAPRPGSGTVEDNLRRYVTEGLGVLSRILPAFAGLAAQPKVFARFRELPAPGAHEHGGGLRAMLAEYLRGEQAKGRIRPDARVEAAASMVIGACHELVLPRLFHGVTDPELRVPEGFVDDLVWTVIRGIGPEGAPPGRTRETGPKPRRR